jgi:ParB/RepB/Spo0J family partition protein
MAKMLSNEFGGNDGLLATLTLNDIHVDETKNLRREGWVDDKDITILASDIVQRGQLSPVVVTRNGEGSYVLVAGFRRFRAIRLANETMDADLPVLARVVEAGDEKVALLDNLAENVKRKDLSPMDMAFAAAKLKEMGLTYKEIAKEFGHHESWLRQVMAFKDLPENVQQGVHSGKIPFTVARKLAGLTPEEIATVLLAVEKALEAGESGAKAAAEAARKGIRGKSTRGANAKDNQKAGKKGLSAKKAILELKSVLEELNAEDAKPTKAEQKAGEIHALAIKFLRGQAGVKTFHKNVVELL